MVPQPGAISRCVRGFRSQGEIDDEVGGEEDREASEEALLQADISRTDLRLGTNIGGSCRRHEIG
jgi:hypothetical protein